MEYMKEHRYNNIDQFTFIYFIQFHLSSQKKKKNDNPFVPKFPIFNNNIYI